MRIKTRLKSYQVDAFNKLKGIKANALYMEMGTGKTRVTLELIKYKLERNKITQVLWMCPCSIKMDLRANILKHIDNDSIIRIEGIESLSQSDRLYLELLNYVTSAKTYLIVDESNLVKNHYAKRTQRMSALAKHCEYRSILNGTPISKNEADLYSQWYILDPRIFGYRSFWSFAANHLEYDDYGNIKRILNIDYLTEKMAPYAYMIEKEEALELPPKKYYTEYFDLTKRQESEYFWVKDKLLDGVDNFTNSSIYKLFTALQRVTSGEEIVKTDPLASRPLFKNPYDNPRIQILLDNIIPDEKNIIWCKFENEIHDIHNVLEKEYGNDSIALYYGKLSQRNRQRELDRFKNDAMFLIANKSCGSYGLNLQYCHNMIYYNNDFNWATRAQSEDRIHRIGQEHTVYITDICADCKIDERILDNLMNKENLADSFKAELKNKRDVSAWIDGKELNHDKNRTNGHREKENSQ